MITTAHLDLRAFRRATSIAVGLLLALVLALPASPAEARSSYQSRVTGRAADTFWTQIDGTEAGTSPFGNVHIGQLYAYETSPGLADVDGWITDFDCEPGEEPGFGHGDEEPGEGLCDFKGERFIQSSGIPFTVDSKLNVARLTGRLTVYGGGHGEGGVVGNPQADVIWTGYGDLARSRYTFRYSDGNTTETFTENSQIRSATMSGILGPMGFDPELSGGSITSFKSSSKSRTK